MPVQTNFHFRCRKTIRVGSYRYRCFLDECGMYCDMCEPCFSKSGHHHHTYKEKGTLYVAQKLKDEVYLTADMQWRLRGSTAAETMHIACRYFANRPWIGYRPYSKE